MFYQQSSSRKTKKQLRIAFVSTCLPRKCGIATFSASLSKALEDIVGRDSTCFVALNNNEPYDYPAKIIYQIEQDNPEHYRKAAEIINESEVDLVSLQHEFGIFGGPDGTNIVEFLSHLRKPVVTTFHTVLEKPSPGQNKAFIEVAAFSQALVVMNKLAVNFMTDLYDIPSYKINLIYHGVPDTFYIDPLYYKHQMDLAQRFVVLTFGFLSPNKGIETVLEGLPKVVKKHPHLLYIVLGITHPVIKKRHGEEYREKLQTMVKQLGLENNVLFLDKFVDNETLDQYLGAADLVICPYHSEGQITSGVLSNSLGKGKAIISTPYLHARDALTDGRGMLVNFKDVTGMSEAITHLIDNPDQRLAMAGQAYIVGQQMSWSRVSRQYLHLCEDVVEKVGKKWSKKPGLLRTLPALNLNYLKVLTDETGIFQHTLYGIPDYSHYYSSDDASRALVACAHYIDLYRDHSIIFLVNKYLAFIAHARKEDGWFYNYMSFQKGFPPQDHSEDTYGRCMWGLGAAARLLPTREEGLLAKELFESSLPLIAKLTYTRAKAYTVCGIASYLSRHPEAKQAEEALENICDSFVKLYRTNASHDWRWFEGFLSYDNARLPQTLLLGYSHFCKPEYLEIALESLDFLIEQQYHNGYFDLIGNDGWYHKGGEKSLYCQQPVDAGSLTETFLLAAKLSEQEKYLDMAYAAFQWYLGRNRQGKSLYNSFTGACADGLGPDGLSKNKGAESTISFLLALDGLYNWELIGKFHNNRD